MTTAQKISRLAALRDAVGIGLWRLVRDRRRSESFWTEERARLMGELSYHFSHGSRTDLMRIKRQIDVVDARINKGL